MNEREIFQSAINIPDASERQAYLDRTCGEDAVMRERIEKLVSAHQEASGFLETPAAEQLSPVSSDQTNPTMMLPQQHGDAGESADADLLDFLEPATKPDSLGRLAHYEVLEVLGRGAFGIVLKAFDDKLHRMVAIKVMNPELASTSPPRKRFLREAQSAARVRHDNIVAIHDIVEQSPPYLVMEYIPGGTLQERLDQKGPLEITDILRIGQQVASGLAAAHAQGLIHRDIKPANILIESGIEERAKITDFGLARATDDASLTQSGLIAGTPMYMSPEQAKGQTLDHRTDLFSLGSVLYTMASGRPPFRAPNTIAVLKRVCEDIPRPISEVIAETPRWLCDIIAKLQAKEPDDRFQSAKEVADLLGQHLAHLQEPTRVPKPAAVLASTTNTKRSIKPLRVAALAALRGPGTGLILTACLNWFCLFLTLCVAFYLSRSQGGEAVLGGFILVVAGILALATSVLLIGGLKMRRGESYGFCIFASIMAMLIGPGYLIGFPVGIWSLFVLSRSNVRAAFRKRQSSEDFLSAADEMAAQETQQSVRTAWSPASVLLAIVVGILMIPLIGGVLIVIALAIPAYQAAQVRSRSSVGTLIVQSDEAFITAAVDDQRLPLPGREEIELRLPAGPHTVTFFKDGERIDLRTIQIVAGQNHVARWPDKPGTVLVDASLPNDWMPLFNGKDLSGWEPNSHWKIEGDGVLVSRVPADAKKTPAMLVTQRKDFSDFHARIVAKLNKGGDSGFFFRFGKQGDQSFQAQLTVAPTLAGGLLRGAYTVAPGSLLVQPDTWFTMEVIARGPHIITIIDGKLALGWVDPTGNVFTGPFALEAGFPGTELQVRSVEVRAVGAASAPIPESPPQPWQPLFNGRDLTGWKTHDSQPGNWQVEEGAIVGTGGVTHLFSERDDFVDFEFRGEVRLNENGNSGVFLRTPFALTDDNPKMRSPVGYELQLIEGNHIDSKRMYLSGGLIPIATPVSSNLIHARQWYKFRVKADGDQFDVWIDDVHTVSTKDPTSQRYRGGHLALQVWTPDTRAEFRNLEARSLRGAILTADTAPWVNLLQTEDVKRLIAPENGITRSDSVILLQSPSGVKGAQMAVESFKLRHARMRIRAVALNPSVAQNISLGWTHGSGTPRRLDAVFRVQDDGKTFAHFWQFGPNFEVSDLTYAPAPVDLTKPIFIEAEVHDGNVTANVAGVNLMAVNGVDPNRPLMPFVGTSGTWKILEWQVQDLSSTPATSVDFNGVWDTSWGPVTLIHGVNKGDRPFEVTGTYTLNGPATIKGTVDPKTRTFRGRFDQTAQSGRLQLTLSHDGKSIQGLYDNFANEPFEKSLPRLAWNMTRPLPPIDLNGEWDSKWGVVTFIHEPPTARIPVPVKATYYNGLGIIEGTLDPTTREFLGNFRESNGMAGRIELKLSDDSVSIVGKYSYKSNPDQTNNWDMTKKGAQKQPPIAVAPFDAPQAYAHQEAWAKYLSVPIDYTNSIGMKFRLIPPGEFLMGNTQDELQKLTRELEQAGANEFDKFVAKVSKGKHLVRITQPFYFGAHEVTVADYRRFAEETKYLSTIDQLGVKRFHWKSSIAEPNPDQRAVIGVSWDDSDAFCKWLSQQHSMKYALPTEAQWEHACRAGTTTFWSFGDDPAQLSEYAVFGRTSFWPAEVVGTKRPNPFGLYDLHGNADEWCRDWHDSGFYGRSPVEDPVMLDNPADTKSGRVARGGTSHSASWWTRSTTRPWDFPATPTNPKGFRVVLSVDDVRAALAKSPPVVKTVDDPANALQPANVERN